MGCSQNDVSEAEFDVSSINKACGYELQTDMLSFTNIFNDAGEYLRYESKTEKHIVECYSDAKEAIILDESDITTQYYTETFDTAIQMSSKPIQAIYEKLKTLSFELIEETEERSIYKTIQIEQITEQEQIDYTEYLIKMNWIDGELYIFSYYEYSDGSTLLSVDAPMEIDNQIIPDTKWEIDRDNQKVVNSETNQECKFEILNSTTGKAVSPIGTATTTKEVTTQIDVYVDKETERIEEITYCNDDPSSERKIILLYDESIKKPDVTNEMKQMDEETLQMNFMLFDLLKSMN